MRYEFHDLFGDKIQIPVPECYKDCWVLIQSDLYRWTGKVEPAFSIVLKLFKPFDSSFLFWFRLSQYNGIFGYFCRFMYKRSSRKNHVDIPLSTKIGYGLYLGHGMCMVVNGKTIIGNNVNLSQFLSIGTNNDTPAIIGDNVYIGPHVSIVEDVRIGSYSTVGAGAVVTKDVPTGATVAGVPAKVLNDNNPGRFIGRRWIPDHKR